MSVSHDAALIIHRQQLTSSDGSEEEVDLADNFLERDVEIGELVRLLESKGEATHDLLQLRIAYDLVEYEY